MKFKLTILLLSFVLATNAHAQINRNHSRGNIVLWGSTGYNNLPNDADGVSALGGLGAAVGLGYEWHRNNFILQFGGEFYRHSSRLSLDDFNEEFHLFDWEAWQNSDAEFLYFYQNFYYFENRDKITINYLNVPLMLGFQKNKFYFLMGAKLGFNLQAHSQVTSLVRSTGRYYYSIKEVEDVPWRFFTRQETGNQRSLDLGMNATASVEMGFYLGNPSNGTRYRLAAFCDYGLMNINTHTPKEYRLLYDPDSFNRPELNSFVNSTDIFADKKLNTLYAGLKFTIVFGLRERQDCHWAGCR